MGRLPPSTGYNGNFGQILITAAAPSNGRRCHDVATPLTPQPRTVRGEVIGWARNLRLTCHKVHVAYLATMGNPGPPAASWGGPPR